MKQIFPVDIIASLKNALMSIDDISVFERIKFYQLYGLYLSDNNIDYSFENNKNIIEKLKILVKNLNI